MTRPTLLAFTQRYSDGSGVQFGVTFDASDSFGPIQVKSSAGEASFPVEELDWLIESLTAIRAIAITPEPPQ